MVQQSLSFVMCDDTSACNQIPSLTLLNNTPAGTRGFRSQWPTSHGHSHGPVCPLREPGPAVGQQNGRAGVV